MRFRSDMPKLSITVLTESESEPFEVTVCVDCVKYLPAL